MLEIVVVLTTNTTNNTTTGLPTGLQPDCLHGLRTAQRFVLVFSLSFLVDACIGLNWLSASF